MGSQASEPIYKVTVEKNLPMQTRDGITLYADVYRPDAPGKFPALLIRTPYDKSREPGPYTERQYFGSRGYVVIVQDTRGRFSSGGDFYPFIHEGYDGYDAIEWAHELPSCNGIVGTVAQSYPGLVQYFAASQRPPHLRAMCPVSGPVTYFENWIYRRGVFELGWMLAYFVWMARGTLAKGDYQQESNQLESYVDDPKSPLFPPLKHEEYLHLPLADWSERLKVGAPYFGDFLRNWKYGPYWQQTDLRGRFHEFDVPTLHVGSWYDIFQYDTLTMYTGLREHSASQKSRRAQRLMMGPWAHLLPYSVPTSGGTGEIDFGPEARIELHDFQLPWFDHFMKGIDNHVLDEPPVRIFVMGNNRWRDEYEWPLKRTRYTDLYLHSRGHSNSLRGDGVLSFSAPADEASDSFVYDPRTPVPSRGGNTAGIPCGVFDQSEIEQREDVLVYTSEVLSDDLEVTGPVKLWLYAASSAPDTDFTAKLCDLRPDSYSQNIVDGVIRARFRESLSTPTPITPDRVYEYAIDLWLTSHVFKAGHRLRLEVSSSNFPRYDRNPNTGHGFGIDTELQTARQTIFHNNLYPSRLILPVIPT